MSTELEKLMAQDAGAAVVPTNNELSELNNLAEMQIRLEQEIVRAESDLKELQEKLKSVQEVAIPELMKSIGIKDFRLTSGFKVTIKEDVFASIRAEFINNAVEWLNEQGLGDVVKDEVKVNFARGQQDEASRLLEFALSNGWNASEKLSVHPQTLKALVKEQMARGVKFPDEYFSVVPFNKSIIKLK